MTSYLLVTAALLLGTVTVLHRGSIQNTREYRAEIVGMAVSLLVAAVVYSLGGAACRRRGNGRGRACHTVHAPPRSGRRTGPVTGCSIPTRRGRDVA